MSSSRVPPPARAAGAAPVGRPDGSMSLLVDVMTNTLDEAYADHAARAAGAGSGAGGAPPRPAGRGGRLAGATVLVLLGVVTGTSVAHVRDRAAAGEGLRGGLAAQVRDRNAETDRLEREAAALRADVTATRDAALEADARGRTLAERVRALELAAGTQAVSGSGVVLTLDDADPDAEIAPEATLRGGSPLDGRVLDRDLQDVVNGLWAAGAEAIAINDVRLSSRAAIRSAGEAVLVDFRPLSPPYRIEAVGRPATLQVEFLDGATGRRLQTLASFSGITFELVRAERLELPAATEPELRSARPGQTP